MRKQGVTNLKTVLVMAFSLGVQISDAVADGKVTFWEGLGLIPELKKFGGLVPVLPIIREELKDLQPNEAEELQQHIAEKFDIPNDEVEEKIEVALEFLTSAYKLIYTMKKK